MTTLSFVLKLDFFHAKMQVEIDANGYAAGASRLLNFPLY